MSSRRNLASVAEGTARAFASRNNDVDGWWALGLLLGAGPGDPDYRIDLLTGQANPEPVRIDLRGLGDAWGEYLRWSLDRHRLSVDVVTSAVLTVRFDRTRDVASWIPGGHDSPFVCTVTIEDDRGRLYERIAEGHCARPDDFADPNPDLRPRRAIVTSSPRVLERVEPPPP